MAAPFPVVAAAEQQGLMPEPKPIDPDSGPVGEGEPNVEPEEQEQYDAFVKNAMTLIYSDKALPKIQEMLAGGDNPVTGLANTTAMIVARVDESSVEAKKGLSGDIILHAGIEILEDLANLSQEAGIHEFTAEEMESAMYQAADRFRQIKGDKGELDGEAFQADMQGLQAADESGELDEMLPGLKEHYAQRAAQGQQQAQPPPEGM